jgi:hypothetical protein
MIRGDNVTEFRFDRSMDGRLCFALVTMFASGCAPTGASFMHAIELPGTCESYISQRQDGGALPRYDFTPLDTMQFTRIHAATAFEGGSQWSGGNVIAAGWRDADGTVWRLQIDIGPERGYGITYVEDSATLQQGIGLVAWRNGTRVFTTQRVFGAMNYIADHRNAPQSLFGRFAFNGTDANGQPVCRVLGVHAAPDVERTDPYDPTWLRPEPSILFRGTAPSYTSDAPPSDHVAAAGEAGADPGGTAPHMTYESPNTLLNSEDFSGGCD